MPTRPMNLDPEEYIQLLVWLVVLIGGTALCRKAHRMASVVWAVVVLLLFAIWAPSSLGAKASGRRSICFNNLKELAAAVQQWALERKKIATDTYSFSDPSVLAYMKGSALPLCPGGGRYSPGANISDLPKCSLAAQGHTL